MLHHRDRSHEHEAAKLELRLRGRALDSTLDAVLITEPVDDGDVVIYANPAFERITGYGRSEIVGSDCRFCLGMTMMTPQPPLSAKR